ncbi:MAG: DNA repair protein RecO [Anaerolineales bacterium]|nr:DNA repair protein RecO [Anaerolineales bacterium]
MPIRERTYRTEAIVLRRKDIGEADRILTLLTPERGKVRVVAKGIRKPRSRKAGHLELFTRTHLLIAAGRDLDIVTQAQLADAHQPIREDLVRGAYAAYAVELMDRFTPEQQESPELYNLLAAMLAWLCTEVDVAVAARYYELRLLALAGYQPELRRCVACGEAIVAEDQFFSVAQGGVVCAKCGKSAGGGDRRLPGLMPISMEALKYLRYFQVQPFNKVAALKLSSNVLSEMEYVLQRYITYLLERQLKSVEFLKLIRREALT